MYELVVSSSLVVITTNIWICMSLWCNVLLIRDVTCCCTDNWTYISIMHTVAYCLVSIQNEISNQNSFNKALLPLFNLYGMEKIWWTSHQTWILTLLWGALATELSGLKHLNLSLAFNRFEPRLPASLVRCYTIWTLYILVFEPFWWSWINSNLIYASIITKAGEFLIYM